MDIEISPVNAPEASALPHCAPVMREALAVAAISREAGKTTTSIPLRGRKGESGASHPGGGGFIFQFAATRGVRECMGTAYAFVLLRNRGFACTIGVMKQRIVLGCDHAGFPLKESLKQFLQKQGIDTVDVGTFSEESVDYPAIIRKACAVVLEQQIPGIVIGGSGNGEAMAANKVRGIRAALCYSVEIARLARAHNDANVMSLGGRFTDAALAEQMVTTFLQTSFEGGRHSARIADLDTPIPA